MNEIGIFQFDINDGQLARIVFQMSMGTNHFTSPAVLIEVGRGKTIEEIKAQAFDRIAEDLEELCERARLEAQKLREPVLQPENS